MTIRKITIIMMMMLMVATSGCSGNDSTATTGEGEIFDSTNTDENIKTICTSLCEERLERDMDISTGPCLTDPLVMEDDWVCDIVHDPRTKGDDKEENQCQAYIEGKAHHFVELDQECNIVRIE